LGGIKAMTLYHKIAIVSRASLNFKRFWGRFSSHYVVK
jgi:hypothetical protein